ncbi:hypothetical protein C8Q76DRAFT_783712 [Earliella scabrosa]|nr:hypothetical protein C8Q76DRAFT_783712 [Earliella scabrosa]
MLFDDMLRPAFPFCLSVSYDSAMLASHASTSINVSPDVSGFAVEGLKAVDISKDSLHRIVPGRARGHAPHGIPDFIVLTHLNEVVLIVEDKIYDDPFQQLTLYGRLFPMSLDIWYLGCRVSPEPQGGLEFMLAYRDRTKAWAPLVVYGSAAEPTRKWWPYNSAHIHNKLRELADLYWKDAECPEESPIE